MKYSRLIVLIVYALYFKLTIDIVICERGSVVGRRTGAFLVGNACGLCHQWRIYLPIIWMLIDASLKRSEAGERALAELRQRRYGFLPLSLGCRGNELSNYQRRLRCPIWISRRRRRVAAEIMTELSRAARLSDNFRRIITQIFKGDYNYARRVSIIKSEIIKSCVTRSRL